MSKIKLNWEQDGVFDSFEVIRSLNDMSNIPDDQLPTPIATGITVKSYEDFDIVQDVTYFYKIRVKRSAFSKVSNQVECSTTSGDIYWEYVTDLMHFNGNINNEAGSNWSGASPIYETGVFNQAARISSPLNKVNSIGNREFTVEFFYKSVTYSSSYPAILIFGSGWSTGALSLNARRTNTGNVVSVYTFDANYFVTTTNINTGNFIHIALERFNDVLTLYVSGVAVGNIPFSGVTLSNQLFLGSTGQNAITMLIDEFRITSGVARYKGNFTPPNEPFPDY